MGLWRRTVLPAVAALVATLTLAACGNGGGLRVEGPESPPPTTPTPSVAFGTGRRLSARRAHRRKWPSTCTKSGPRLLADRHLSSLLADSPFELHRDFALPQQG